MRGAAPHPQRSSSKAAAATGAAGAGSAQPGARQHLRNVHIRREISYWWACLAAHDRRLPAPPRREDPEATDAPRPVRASAVTRETYARFTFLSLVAVRPELRLADLAASGRCHSWPGTVTAKEFRAEAWLLIVGAAESDALGDLIEAAEILTAAAAVPLCAPATCRFFDERPWLVDPHSDPPKREAARALGAVLAQGRAEAEAALRAVKWQLDPGGAEAAEDARSAARLQRALRDWRSRKDSRARRRVLFRGVAGFAAPPPPPVPPDPAPCPAAAPPAGRGPLGRSGFDHYPGEPADAGQLAQLNRLRSAPLSLSTEQAESEPEDGAADHTHNPAWAATPAHGRKLRLMQVVDDRAELVLPPVGPDMEATIASSADSSNVPSYAAPTRREIRSLRRAAAPSWGTGSFDTLPPLGSTAGSESVAASPRSLQPERFLGPGPSAHPGPGRVLCPRPRASRELRSPYRHRATIEIPAFSSGAGPPAPLRPEWWPEPEALPALHSGWGATACPQSPTELAPRRLSRPRRVQARDGEKVHNRHPEVPKTRELLEALLLTDSGAESGEGRSTASAGRQRPPHASGSP